jgi:predicted NBD/HSP70 family sugar kinase
MCGKRGCWETQVGSRVAVQNYKASTGRVVTFEELVVLFRAKDPASIEVFTKMALALGVGIGSLANIFYPRFFVVGGALQPLSDMILPIARDTFARNSLFQPQQDIQIIPSALGPDSCVLGCIALVLDEVIRQRTQL